MLLAVLLCIVPRPAAAGPGATSETESLPSSTPSLGILSAPSAATSLVHPPSSEPAGAAPETAAEPVAGATMPPPATVDPAWQAARTLGRSASASAGSSAERPGAETSGASARTGSAASRQATGKLAIIIDDAGYSMQELEPFLDLPGAISIAVLPGLEHSVEAARRVRAAGKALLLHLPMEPEGESNPGPGPITVGMSAAAIRSAVVQALDELGTVGGVNNHMGSRATADAVTMRAVLGAIEGRGLAFVDSVTTPASVVQREAAGRGIPVASRDVFLDNEAEGEAMRRQLEEAVRLARSRGEAIAIGHVQSPGLAALLRAELPKLARAGISLVAARELARSVGRGQ